MSFTAILRSELIKYRRSVLWKGVILIPVLSFVLLFTDLHFRYDYLTSSSHINKLTSVGIYNKLDVLIYENHLATLWFMLLSLGIVSVSVIVNYTEYSEKTWKQILARPVERKKVYLSKWMVTAAAVFILIVLNGAALIIMKRLYNMEGDSSIIFKYKILELVAAMGIVSFQQFISCYIKNSLVAAAIGFSATIGAYLIAQSSLLGNICPYSCVLRALPVGDMRDAVTASASGATLCVLWLLIGLWEFNKRDIQ